MTAGSRGHVTDAEGGAVPGVRFVCSSWPCRAVGSRGVRASRGRCRLRAGPIPKPKSKLTRGDRSGQDKLETLACDRKSQSDVSGDEWDAESQLAPRMEALADGMSMSWLFTSFVSCQLTALMSARHACRSESTELHVRALSLHHPLVPSAPQMALCRYA
ncbi:uncharacterized protein LOC128087797 isoform X1 [Tympanuchus pallidicinctus]|uniref:uncharacterized protein LOC128087797 isoform X1 n=1 Tax=Tympanuchus pallidicinctus TaxID=109042 RepID=UPI002287214E|nr:uncharacterized protein LOC128087797 isoform X1 [Tympanuchus pallidicinctus]